MRSRFGLTVLVLLIGCGSRDTLPPVTTGGEPPVSGGEGVESDPMRVGYAALLLRCDERREQLQSELNHARRRQRNLSVAAAAVYVAGELADSQNDSDVHTGMGGQPECPANRDPMQPGPCPQPVPTVADPRSPTVSDTDRIRTEALTTIDSINAAIDASDAFLFGHTQPARWTPEEKQEWDSLQSQLASLCDAPMPS